MPAYEFQCESCPAYHHGKADAFFEQSFPMTEAPPLDSFIKCKACGRMTAKRIISSGVMSIVKGNSEIPWDQNNAVRANINGQDIRFSFVDHPHTDPAYQRNLHELAGRNNLTGDSSGLKNARYDEKLGRMVVDVISNVPDPLGKLEAAKRAGQFVAPKKRNVNQKYRVRPKKKR